MSDTQTPTITKLVSARGIAEEFFDELSSAGSILGWMAHSGVLIELAPYAAEASLTIAQIMALVDWPDDKIITRQEKIMKRFETRVKKVANKSTTTEIATPTSSLILPPGVR